MPLRSHGDTQYTYKQTDKRRHSLTETKAVCTDVAVSVIQDRLPEYFQSWQTIASRIPQLLQTNSLRQAVHQVSRFLLKA